MIMLFIIKLLQKELNEHIISNRLFTNRKCVITKLLS